MTDAPVLTAPRGSAKPLDTLYDVALLDLDGTVYLGGAAIAGAAEALREAGAGGHAAGLRNQQRQPDPRRHRRAADQHGRPGDGG